MNAGLYWKIVKDSIAASLKNGMISKEEAEQLERECASHFPRLTPNEEWQRATIYDDPPQDCGWEDSCTQEAPGLTDCDL